MDEDDTRAAERADVLAYLDQRLANCTLMEAKAPEFADEARERGRQLAVMIDELGAGLHEGAAEVRAMIVAAAAARRPEGDCPPAGAPTGNCTEDARADARAETGEV